MYIVAICSIEMTVCPVVSELFATVPGLASVCTLLNIVSCIVVESICAAADRISSDQNRSCINTGLSPIFLHVVVVPTTTAAPARAWSLVEIASSSREIPVGVEAELNTSDMSITFGCALLIIKDMSVVSQAIVAIIELSAISVGLISHVYSFGRSQRACIHTIFNGSSQGSASVSCFNVLGRTVSLLSEWKLNSFKSIHL
jgi:hypothetical protein